MGIYVYVCKDHVYPNTCKLYSIFIYTHAYILLICKTLRLLLFSLNELGRTFLSSLQISREVM